jgi:hypothetical protein
MSTKTEKASCSIDVLRDLTNETQTNDNLLDQESKKSVAQSMRRKMNVGGKKEDARRHASHLYSERLGMWSVRIVISFESNDKCY